MLNAQFSREREKCMLKKMAYSAVQRSSLVVHMCPCQSDTMDEFKVMTLFIEQNPPLASSQCAT
jgi:hypothetical protein